MLYNSQRAGVHVVAGAGTIVTLMVVLPVMTDDGSGRSSSATGPPPPVPTPCEASSSSTTRPSAARPASSPCPSATKGHRGRRGRRPGQHLPGRQHLLLARPRSLRGAGCIGKPPLSCPAVTTSTGGDPTDAGGVIAPNGATAASDLLVDERGCGVPGRTRPRSWSALRPHLLVAARPAAMFAASRLLVLVAVEAIIDLHGTFASNGFTGPFPKPPPGPPLLQALATWDSGWYLAIAHQGYFLYGRSTYLTPSVAFFPVWPGLIRVVSRITGLSVLPVGLALAFVFGAGASVALWYLVRELCDSSVADRAVALWVFFPGAFVLSMVYAEGLTVLCCAVCLLALLRHRWLIAGLAAGLATGVQPDALVLVACCVWAAGRALWKDRQWAAVIAPVLSVAGAVGYFSYLWAATGDVMRWYHVEQQDWGSDGAVHRTVVLVLRGAFDQPHNPELVIPAFGLATALVGLVLMFRWKPPAVLWIFAVGVLAAALTSGPVGARPRLLLVIFPFVIAASRTLRGQAFNALFGASAGLLGVVTILTLSGRVVTP